MPSAPPTAVAGDAAMSPMANTSGCPWTVRSASTTMRPPLVSSTPSISASGLARTPAAHTTTPAGSTVPSVRWTSRRVPSVVIRATPTPVLTSTPRRDRVRRARSLDFVDIAPSSRGAASTRTTRAARTSMVGKSLASTRVNSSIIAPAVSTPVGPPPHDDDVELAASDAGRIARRPLEALQHGEAQVEGVVEVLQRDRVLVDAVDPDTTSTPPRPRRPGCRSAARRRRRRRGRELTVLASRSIAVTVAMCTVTLRWPRNTPRTA